MAGGLHLFVQFPQVPDGLQPAPDELAERGGCGFNPGRVCIHWTKALEGFTVPLFESGRTRFA